MKKLRIATKKKKTNKVGIFLDSSIIVASIDKDDKHNLEIRSLLNALKPYNEKQSLDIFIPHIVKAESLSRVMQKLDCSGKVALKLFDKFTNEFDLCLMGGPRIDQKFVDKIYSELSTKYSIRHLSANDLIIIFMAMELGAIVITCDVKMKSYGSKFYRKKIYFVSSHSKKLKNEAPLLLTEFYRN